MTKSHPGGSWATRHHLNDAVSRYMDATIALPLDRVPESANMNRKSWYIAFSETEYPFLNLLSDVTHKTLRWRRASVLDYYRLVPDGESLLDPLRFPTARGISLGQARISRVSSGITSNSDANLISSDWWKWPDSETAINSARGRKPPPSRVASRLPGNAGPRRSAATRYTRTGATMPFRRFWLLLLPRANHCNAETTWCT